jgi:hypothetical protein
LTFMPSSAARRWIMRQASTRCIAVAASTPVRPIAERKRGVFSSPDASGTNVLIEEGFELMMGRHFVALAAFLVEPHPPALAVGEVLDPHRHDGADAGEGVGHDADQGAVAQATCLGPRTEVAGLLARIPPVASQSNSMRMAARCCLTVGFVSI